MPKHDSMRILLLNDYQSLGGVEVVVDRTAELLTKQGHEVRVLTGDQCAGSQNPLGYISSRRAKRSLKKILRDFGPEAIHIHNLYHLLSPAILGVCKSYCAQTGARLIMTVHDHHLVCPNPGGCYWKSGQRHIAPMPVASGLLPMLARRWDHRSRTHSVLRVLQRYWNYTLHARHLIPDTILSPAPTLAKLVSELGHPDVRVVLNPLADKPGVLRPTAVDFLRVAIAGRIDPEKGVAVIIEHWPRDLKATIQIAGQGTDLERCRQIYASRKTASDALSVEFLGHLPHKEAMCVIARADLLIVPSIGPEVAPLVLDEAIIAGTQILISDQPALRAAVERLGHGWVFDPADPSDFDKKLREIEAARLSGILLPKEHSKTLPGRSPETYINELLAAYTGHPSPAHR
ncbi:MAG: glycosyltransferase [Phycisphaerales bacterium]|nr:glycosyltransferase [Phycisphaerales bacterium]